MLTKPSNQSVKFVALVDPIIINNIKKKYKKPNSI